MKANELMLGNWVYRPDCYDRVTEIRTNGIIGLDSLRGLIPFGEIKPIPLNKPDILQRIGFKVEEGYDENYDDYEYYATMICFDTRRCKVEVKYETSNKKISVFSSDRQNILQYRSVETQIRYVHELQNLFTIMQVEKEIEL